MEPDKLSQTSLCSHCTDSPVESARLAEKRGWWYHSNAIDWLWVTNKPPTDNPTTTHMYNECFKPVWSSKTDDLKIYACHFLAMRSALLG